MGFSKPPGVPCPPNNPHCQGLEPVGASIENWILATIIIVLITIYIYYKMKNKCTCFNSGTNCFSGMCNVCNKQKELNKPKVKITVSEIEKINTNSNLVTDGQLIKHV